MSVSHTDAETKKNAKCIKIYFVVKCHVMYRHACIRGQLLLTLFHGPKLFLSCKSAFCSQNVIWSQL